MKKPEKTTTTFFVNAKIKADVYVEIEAKDFDEAVAKAKELRVDDFIETTSGDVTWLDHEYRMTGVYE